MLLRQFLVSFAVTLVVVLTSPVASFAQTGNFEQPTVAGPQSSNQVATPANSGLGSWFGQREMTGDWGGLRTRLEKKGVIFRGHFITESAFDALGGKARGGRYAHEVNLGADIDFAKLTGLDLGTFHITLTERAGANASAALVGNIQDVQEIWGDGQTVRLTELVYGHDFFNDRVDVEAGRVITEEDFAASPTYWGLQVYCDFQSLAICGTPLAAPNDSGFTAYPASVWGARAKIYADPGHHFHADAGIYEVQPAIVNSHNGFDLSSDDVTGVYLPVEFGWSFGPGSGYHGNYNIGGYYDSSEVREEPGFSLSRFLVSGSPALGGLPSQMQRGRYGFWAFGDQTLELDGSKSKRGLMGFVTFEAGDQPTSLLPYTATLGLVRHGTFADRPNDTVNLAFAVAVLNSRLAREEGLLQSEGMGTPRQAQEYMTELNYGYQIAAWFILRPGFQYVWHPSGENEIPNAFVLDVQTSITF